MKFYKFTNYIIKLNIIFIINNYFIINTEEILFAFKI